MHYRQAIFAVAAATFFLAGTNAVTAQESILTSFGSPGCAAQPDSAPVFDANGNIYGTCLNSSGAGFVYELTPKAGGGWTEQTIFAFGADGTTDKGSGPNGVIFDAAKANLYGTTSAGGSQGNGVVYELSPNGSGGWTEKLLYSFGTNGASDGIVPMGSLVFDPSGNLYGTTSEGGANLNSGTVFELSPGTGGGWTETVIHSFSLLDSGGSGPQNGLILDTKGNLYGTTNGGAGTVFELSPAAGGTWTAQTIANFSFFSNPAGNLIFDSSGNLYGVSSAGGAYGTGAVYEWSPASGGAWAAKTIYSFGQTSSDGTSPKAGVILGPKGVLYGSTAAGGQFSGTGAPEGYGTLFELIPGSGTWTEKILHNFDDPDNSDAFHPDTDLAMDAAGNVYGSASGGVNADGAVFELYSPTTVEPPQFSPAAGTYITAQSVEITDPTLDSTIYYTTNGTTPTTSSTKYTGAISVATTETIEAIGVAAGLTNSPMASATYAITPPAATPVFSPVAGTYATAQKVTITDATSGAAIYYTINGTTPTTASTKYSGAISVSGTETIEAVAIATGYSVSNVAEGVFTIEVPAATPVITPPAGTYTASQKVTITDATSGAVIYYTTNGTTPTASSTKYTGQFTVSTSETVEAIAIASGYLPSAVASAKFTLTPPAATPAFSPVAGTYPTAQKVTITDATTGAAIYYTINGTTPTTSSTRYSSAITVSASETIEAVAVATGYSLSAVGSAAYVIETPAATPVFTPPAGAYTGTQTVTITDATPGAAIYYSTNGTTPTTASTKYTGAFSVATTETLEAIAIAPGYLSSGAATAKYTISPLPWVEKVLYGLGGGAGLVVDAKGNFYSTTEYGGPNNGGTVFEISPAAGGTWTEKQLYTFGASAADGINPNPNGLTIDAKGNLYGTAFHGGGNACGVVTCGAVFELTPSSSGSWTEKILYSFGATSTDGKLPEAGVILDAAGNIYGTTFVGGAYGSGVHNGGTVFELTPATDGTWTEKILYSFGATTMDQVGSSADLVFDAQGNLYGTTSGGGASGNGTIFELTPNSNGSWTEKVIYNFGAVSNDGAAPFAPLIFDAKGNLYGTTFGGGANQVGTAFELMPAANGSWTEKILYSFGAYGADANSSQAGLVFDTHGNLFGSTGFGGATGAPYGVDGAIFELTPAANGKWTESILHNFAGYTATSKDGSGPSGLIIDALGNLFGTTGGGGPSNVGSVFEIQNNTVAAPAFSPAAGIYAPGQAITITDQTPGSTIYYTTNGATPTTASTRYTAPIDLSAATTIKAIAVATGYLNSVLSSATYTVGNFTATPVITPTAGTYTSAQTISITDTTAGAIIYYTTNGAMPTTASTKYTAAFKLSATAAVKAIATAASHLTSAVASSAYTIETPAATPVFTPAAGTYTSTQSVKINDSTTGATIYYTLNGTTPTASSTKYTAPISVAATTKIEAIAIAAGFTNSAVASATYTITLPPMITLSPKTLAFPNAASGATGSPLAITVSNTGATSVTLTSISIAGTSATSFQQVNNCGASLTSGASCSVYVAFKPPSAGAKTATLQVADNASGSPQTVALSGTATAADSVTLSKSSLTFASTTVGTTTEAQSVTLANAGASILDITGIAITGANATSFNQVSTCGTTLAPAANCLIYIAFKPLSAGALTGNVTISDTGAASPQTIKLTGTGAN